MEEHDHHAILDIARNLPDWFNERGLAQMAQDLQSQRGFVAQRNGRVVGFATWHSLGDDTADLSWLAVAKGFHRQGIGSALVETLLHRLHADQVRYLEVSTVADSVDDEPYANTRKFYRALGFRDLRVDPSFWGEGTDRYDRLVLRLDLTARP